MAKKNKNNLYLIILIVLIGIYLLGKYVINIEKDSNFDMEIIKVDTSLISSINIINPKQENTIEIYKDNDKWYVKQANNKSLADDATVNHMLKTIADFKIQNVVGTNESKWEEYKLNDSLATNVQFFNSQNQLIKDVYIGKFIYKQNDSPYQQQGRNNGVGLTYVRLAKAPESFIIEGFLPMTFNRKFNDFRNQRILTVKKDQIDQVSFKYPGDSSFVLARTDSMVFLINQTDTADFRKVNSFLTSLSNLKEHQFDDNFIPSSSSPLFVLDLSGKEIKPLKINVYIKDEDNYIINSSQFPHTYFLSKRDRLNKKLLRSNQSFN